MKVKPSSGAKSRNKGIFLLPGKSFYRFSVLSNEALLFIYLLPYYVKK